MYCTCWCSARLHWVTEQLRIKYSPASHRSTPSCRDIRASRHKTTARCTTVKLICCAFLVDRFMFRFCRCIARVRIRTGSRVIAPAKRLRYFLLRFRNLLNDRVGSGRLETLSAFKCRPRFRSNLLYGTCYHASCT